MLNISSSLRAQFSAYLQEKVIPKNNQAVYQKWLRYYLDSRFHGNDVWRRNFLRSYSEFLQLIEMIGGFRGLFFLPRAWNIGMVEYWNDF